MGLDQHASPFGHGRVGLAEAQQVLMANGLRSRVRLRVDGGFLTGRQVIVAALEKITTRGEA